MAAVLQADWIVDGFAFAYEAHSMALPLGIRAHCTWSGSSKVLAKGASVQDVCVVAGWYEGYCGRHSMLRFKALVPFLDYSSTGTLFFHDCL